MRKGRNGLLYLTREEFMYTHNPILYLPYGQVTEVTFDKVISEVSRPSRTFDMLILERHRKTPLTSLNPVRAVTIPMGLEGDEHDYAATMNIVCVY
jgi:hypothetical protein